MYKKGLVPQVITIFILFLVLIAIVIGWWAFSLIAPPVLGVVGEGVQAFQTLGAGDPNLNRSIETTVVNTYKGFEQVRWLSYAILIASLAAFIMIAFFVRSYPFLAVFWIGFMVVLIFISIYLSSAYIDLIGPKDQISAYYTSFQGNDFFMQYLPHLMVGFALVGGLVLFILVPRDADAEGGV